ncbi:MAG: nucleotidyltransferase domain-containing protein, partial [Spirochaetota bacterium]|nr:nucleotidyltransferase domain-containing protein [Spirochaetota bacterium]
MMQTIIKNKPILSPGEDVLFATELKALLKKEFDRLKSCGNLSGREICMAITHFIDWVIQEVYSQLGQLYGERTDITIIALGGYGRTELNPYSDIDLLFLHSREDSSVEEFIGKILCILWDMKLTLGHSSRSLKNVQAMAHEDIKFKSSLIHHRFVCGNAKDYNNFSSTVNKIFQSHRYQFYQSLLESLNFHTQSLGESVLLKEPNVKESLGALRGIHLVRWLGYNFFQCDTLKALADKNLVDRKLIEKIEDHLEFFLVLRNDLHFYSNRKEDNLLLEHQENLANTQRPDHLTDSKDYMPWLKEKIESGMRGFYLRAKEVFYFVQRMIDIFEVEANKYRHFARLLNKRKFISDQLLMINKKLYIRKKPEAISFSPETLMRIFSEVQRHDCRLSYELEKYIQSNLQEIDQNFRGDLMGFQVFEEILSSERHLYHTLSHMHHCGLLSQYLPFFEELECTVQHDYYHAYTVDEHTLQGI